MKQLEMLYEGKAKQVFRTDDDDVILMHYKDAATAFNNIKKATIEGKGVPLEKQDLFINSTLAQLGCNILWKMFRHGMIEHHGLFLNLETMKVNPIGV